MNGIAKPVEFALEKRNFQNNFPHFVSKKVQDFKGENHWCELI